MHGKIRPLLVRLLALVVLVLLASSAAPRSVRADGDPASDYLLTEDVFVPFDAHVSNARAQELAGLALDARKKGYRVKIALIATPADLGAITALWRRPQQYANFLGQELRLVYRGRLLIVMPNGFGVYRLRQSISREQRALAGLEIDPEGDGLAVAGILAVKRLGAAAGLRLSPLRVNSPSRTTTRDRIAIVMIVVGVLLALVALRSFLLERRRPGPSDPPSG